MASVFQIVRSRVASPRLLASLALAAWLLGAAGLAGAAPSVDEEKAQTVVHMLDYVGVDYPQFVRDGKVLDASEYEEQREFAGQAIALLQQLPTVAQTPALLEQARALHARIDAKADGKEVSALADALRAEVIRAYGLTVAPRQAPDLAAGARLYATQCASCHGAGGRGDGALAKDMEPPPSDFGDEGRMSVRSLYGLYNTISLGVAGTSMRPFGELPEADRWALAFFVDGVRSRPDVLARGEALWKQGQGKEAFPDLRALVTATPRDVAARGGADLAAIQAFLTAHPEAVQAAVSPLARTRAGLDDVVQAYRAGDREAARRLAIGAYLEGFELVESSLDNVDAPLRAETEREMMALRAAISAGQPVQAIEDQVGRIRALLDRAEEKLSAGNLSPGAAFVSALLILLREGLEAILVLSAIVAFVVKTGRRDALPYIHAGWIGAMALGLVTWVVARYLLTISGANRELTEGITALVAAVMLLYVGYWLHNKSNARAWQAFIRDHVTTALARRTLWAMAGISFLAVYRELFEIILFYEALWVQVGPDGQQSVLGGIAAAIVLLALIGSAILKYSVRLPLGPFFVATSGLLAFMAVVFVGNGIAALQEAGVVDATIVHFVSLPLLGIHATVQGLSMQLLTLALVVAGVLIGRRRMARQAAG